VRKRYLILEYSEFDTQRFGFETNKTLGVLPDDRQLSFDSFDKHLDNLRQANLRLNGILNGIFNTYVNNKMSIRSDYVEGQNVSDLKILRIVKNELFFLDFYITFVINEKEYYGVIKNFDKNPMFFSEAFKVGTPDLYVTKEWIIRTKGAIIRSIKNWLIAQRGTYLALKDVDCFSDVSGKIITIKKGDKIEVLGVSDKQIIITYNKNRYNIRGLNYYYFNYWFKLIELKTTSI
jgi:hypothetical protein